MSKTEMLNALVENKGGYLLLSEALNLGISKTYIDQYLKERNFERVAHGLYKSEDAWTDELYILTLKNDRAVCSFDTALMLHGLTEREPSEIFVTVPRKYNASHLRNKGAIVYQVKEEWFDLGITYAETVYGNKVRAYDAERTICDILRVKDKKDPQMFIYAMKTYAGGKEKNLSRLMKYAEIFGVEKELRGYMEVLL